ncbi:MAG: GDP-mannose 4,6-dehydratase [Firmicutes bacterium]|nr:GDP-mannose 4,6-dehydratase [Bacillota bacterium]
MRVAVTGSRGFVGRHVVEEMTGAGHSVWELSGPGEGEGVDVRDATGLNGLFRDFRPEAVIHLAALSSVRDSWDTPGQTADVNVVGTINVWQAAKGAGAERFIFVSSGEVYGFGDAVHTEDERPEPRSPYAVSKYAAELFLSEMGADDAMATVILRPFSHIGPGQSPHFAIPSFARQLWTMKMDGKPCVRAGNVNVSRDFLDVRDVARAYRRAVETPELRGTFNICSGVNRTLRRVIADMAALLDLPMPLAIVSEDQRRRKTDVPVMRGSAEKFRTATGWKPLIAWPETLSAVLRDASPKTAAHVERSLGL